MRCLCPTEKAGSGTERPTKAQWLGLGVWWELFALEEYIPCVRVISCKNPAFAAAAANFATFGCGVCWTGDTTCGVAFGCSFRVTFFAFGTLLNAQKLQFKGAVIFLWSSEMSYFMDLLLLGVCDDEVISTAANEVRHRRGRRWAPSAVRSVISRSTRCVWGFSSCKALNFLKNSVFKLLEHLGYVCSLSLPLTLF